MRAFIEKKEKLARVLRIFILVMVILAVGCFVAMTLVDDVTTVVSPMIITINVFWITGVVYLGACHSVVSNVKWLESKGLRNVADDINLDHPVLPHSDIYCGWWALFCKKTNAIIPYAEIAWVYYHVKMSYGIAVEKSVIIYTKDGRKFFLKANEDEFRWVLENYIIRHTPNIILGYGAEQKALYKQLNPQFSQAGKKVKKTWGKILMCIGVFFLVLTVVNIDTVEVIPVTIMILGAFCSGAILYMIGNKK